MSRTDAFFDTNIILYAISTDRDKAARSAQIVREGGVISVQVLNEFALVSRRKYKADWSVVRRGLQDLRDGLDVVPLTLEVHALGIQYSERFRIGVYDSMLIAAAQLAGCTTLWSEDMHDGLTFNGLTIRNPFR